MKIKSEGLIKYFNSQKIDEKSFEALRGRLSLDFRKYPDIDIEEVIQIFSNYSEKIKTLNLVANDYETFHKVLLSIPQNFVTRLFIEDGRGEVSYSADEFKNFSELIHVGVKGKRDAILKKLQVPSNLESINITGFERIEEIDTSQNSNIEVTLVTVSRKLFNSLKEEITSKVGSIAFSRKDSKLETLDISEIRKKFENAVDITNLPILTNLNVHNLEDIAFLLPRCANIGVDKELMDKYKKWLEENPDRKLDTMELGSRMIYNTTFYQNVDQGDRSRITYYGFKVNNDTNFAEIKEKAGSKTVVFLISNVTDLSYEMAKKIKEEGIQGIVKVFSRDNGIEQNTEYSLEEYIAISHRLNELVSGIDDNLPEEEIFRNIYLRVSQNIEYDYAAAYPKTKEEKKYAKENSRKCRNLYNGLIHGKAVCAGYADILKNACLLKGIECEYIQGPVDSIKSKGYYLRHRKENEEFEELIHIDKKNAITREYHAWNKVKINGVWYNVDSTWDREYVTKFKTPLYVFMSDDFLRDLGRPTSRTERHPCNITMKASERTKIFSALEPCTDIYGNPKLMQFEKTLDEFGNPRELPVVVNDTFWSRMMQKIGKFLNRSKEKIKGLWNKNNNSINSKEEPTAELPVLPSEKKASWELSEEQLKAVKGIEFATNNDNLKEKQDHDAEIEK